jgi:two-component system, NarL family, invasion response regulator UvrY
MLVDEHDLMRAGIKYALSGAKGIKVVKETNNGEDAVKLARELNPEIIIMDIQLSGISGLDATKRILQYNPKTKVIIITAFNDTVYPIRLLEAGVSGYLTKRSSLPTIVQAIKNVHAGQRYICPEIAQRMVFEKMGGAGGTPFDNLSNRELQIALLVAKGKRPSNIATKLNLSSKTIHSYRYRIFRKLKITGDVDLAKLIIQYGLLTI